MVKAGLTLADELLKIEILVLVLTLITCEESSKYIYLEKKEEVRSGIVFVFVKVSILTRRVIKVSGKRGAMFSLYSLVCVWALAYKHFRVIRVCLFRLSAIQSGEELI